MEATPKLMQQDGGSEKSKKKKERSLVDANSVTTVALVHRVDSDEGPGPSQGQMASPEQVLGQRPQAKTSKSAAKGASTPGKKQLNPPQQDSDYDDIHEEEVTVPVRKKQGQQVAQQDDSDEESAQPAKKKKKGADGGEQPVTAAVSFGSSPEQEPRQEYKFKMFVSNICTCVTEDTLRKKLEKFTNLKDLLVQTREAERKQTWSAIAVVENKQEQKNLLALHQKKLRSEKRVVVTYYEDRQPGSGYRGGGGGGYSGGSRGDRGRGGGDFGEGGGGGRGGGFRGRGGHMGYCDRCGNRCGCCGGGKQ